MDPRFRRSQEALRATVLAVAAERPIGDVTVADLCREAGITRDTFYRHAGSPLALLADALGDELTTVTAGQQEPGGGVSRKGGFRASERALLQHVAQRAEIYRQAMQPTLPALLRANFEKVLRDALAAHLRRYPQTLPPGVDASDPFEVELVAAYAASGTVGAVEVWLRTDLDVDRGVRLVLAASPRFWFTATGEDPTV